jgi:hypothetical protein
MAQINPDAALAAFRRAYGEAADTGVLLRAHIAELETENERLRAKLAEQELAAAFAGPDPAAMAQALEQQNALAAISDDERSPYSD